MRGLTAMPGSLSPSIFHFGDQKDDQDTEGAGVPGAFGSLDSGTPTCCSATRSVPTREVTQHPLWSNQNAGEEGRNGRGGAVRGSDKGARPWGGTQCPNASPLPQKPFTSDSRQDMNFKTTCLRYSKLTSRASVGSV